MAGVSKVLRRRIEKEEQKQKHKQTQRGEIMAAEHDQEMKIEKAKSKVPAELQEKFDHEIFEQSDDVLYNEYFKPFYEKLSAAFEPSADVRKKYNELKRLDSDLTPEARNRRIFDGAKELEGLLDEKMKPAFDSFDAKEAQYRARYESLDVDIHSDASRAEMSEIRMALSGMDQQQRMKLAERSAKSGNPVVLEALLHDPLQRDILQRDLVDGYANQYREKHKATDKMLWDSTQKLNINGNQHLGVIKRAMRRSIGAPL